MSAYRDDNQGELISFLLNMRERFDSEEEFRAFVLGEVRRFITDLRSMDIELTLRPNFGGQPVSHHSVTQKLAER
jgi:hypothetical protein